MKLRSPALSAELIQPYRARRSSVARVFVGVGDGPPPTLKPVRPWPQGNSSAASVTVRDPSPTAGLQAQWARRRTARRNRANRAGQVVAVGTPEDVAKNAKSWTGKFLVQTFARQAERQKRQKAKTTSKAKPVAKVAGKAKKAPAQAAE